MLLRLLLLILAGLLASKIVAVQLDVDNSGLFSDELGDEEEKEVISHFECYDLTNDAEKIICLDQSVFLLHQTLENIYDRKVALAQGSDTFFLTSDYEQWLTDRSKKCAIEASCYTLLYKQKIVEMNDNKRIAQVSFRPNQHSVGVLIDLYGRRSDGGYLIDRIDIQKNGNKKNPNKNNFEHIYLYKFLNGNNWELFMPSAGFEQLDVNFDDYDDLIIFLGDRGPDGASSVYFIYQPEDGSFVSDPALNKLNVSTFNHDYGLIHVDWQQDDGRFGTDYYGYNHKGKLTRMFRHSYIRFNDDNGEEKVSRSTYKNRGKKLAKISTDTISPEQIGDIQSELFVSQQTTVTPLP